MTTRTKYWLGGALTVALTVLLTGCGGCPPGILGCNPAAGAVHTPVTITGQGFGSVQGAGFVTFNGLPAQVLSWSNTEITVRVPVIPTPGGSSTPVNVVVDPDHDLPTAPIPFTVIRGILFTSNRDGNSEIYVMNPDGSGQTNLTGHPAADSYASWSPDGTKVAFASHRDGNDEIYVMDANGANQTRITNDPARDTWPRWSPDGTKFLFERTLTSYPEIYVMNVDGTGVTQLTNHPSRDQYAVWSPDGSKIAFASYRDGNFNIYVMNADGSGLNRLTDTPGHEMFLSWSPDGTKIAFSADPYGESNNPDTSGHFDLYVMNSDGTGVTQLTNTLQNERTNSWSPDGKKIAYARVDASWDYSTFDVYVMNADGTGQTRLTDAPGWDGVVAWTH